MIRQQAEKKPRFDCAMRFARSTRWGKIQIQTVSNYKAYYEMRHTEMMAVGPIRFHEFWREVKRYS